MACNHPFPKPALIQQIIKDLLGREVSVVKGAPQVIERDGKRIARVPEKPANPFGRPLFQGLQYSDTPVQPLATMTYTDAGAAAGTPHDYRVIAVNTVGLESR